MLDLGNESPKAILNLEFKLSLHRERKKDSFRSGDNNCAKMSVKKE
jgi:hypothetical protein